MSRRTMDTTGFESRVSFDSDDEHGPASMPTSLPAPPRMPSLVCPAVSIIAPRRGLVLVASNPRGTRTRAMQMRATVPALHLVRNDHPSLPPPSIPPTGSTPIRRAA